MIISYLFIWQFYIHYWIIPIIFYVVMLKKKLPAKQSKAKQSKAKQIFICRGQPHTLFVWW